MSAKRGTRSNSIPMNEVPHGANISIKTLNPYITCPLCSGYFVDATTVIDCLHTFCKSCLLKHFEKNVDCPKCHSLIHQSHPSHYVACDRTMQDIVYKIVPRMQVEEQKRRTAFLSKNKITDSKLLDLGVQSVHQEADKNNSSDEEACCASDDDLGSTHHRSDEPLLVQLIPDSKLQPIERPFISLSVLATVNTVKRLVAYLLLNDLSRYNDIDIFCNNELMGRDYSMSFIQKTRWRNRGEPVVLMYKEHLDF